MKQGDKVNIYHDPLFCKKLEGKAILVKQLPSLFHNVEYWVVRFDDGESRRAIKV